MARPTKDIPWETLDTLAELGCTLPECAEVLRLSVRTIQRAMLRKHGEDYGTYCKKRIAIRLRVCQWESAAAGSVPMLIWLGKQYLGQSNTPADPPAADAAAKLDKLTSVLRDS